MIYQLPNGKVINLTIEEYLDLDDYDIQYLLSVNAGYHVPQRNPFMDSAIEQKKELEEDEEESEEESCQEDFPEMPEPSEEIAPDPID